MSSPKIIKAIGIHVPSDDIDCSDVSEQVALHDADIVLFRPAFDHIKFKQFTSDGTPLVPFRVGHEYLKLKEHWIRQISEAMKANKPIIILLPKIIEFYSPTGQRLESDKLHTNYQLLPFTLPDFHEASAKSFSKAENSKVIDKYWQVAEKYSRYFVYFENSAESILMTRDKNHTVGARFGNIILLPDLSIPSSMWREPTNNGSEFQVSEEGQKFLKNLVKGIKEIDRSLRSSTTTLPAPEWAKSAEFELEGERKLNDEIAAVKHDLKEFKKKRQKLEQNLADSNRLKALLYGSGRELENAVAKALKILGFKAVQTDTKDPLMENDGVFQSPEGIILVEVEGKKTKSVNLDKLRQLHDKISIHLDKHSVEPKGVLAGNTCLDQPLNDRGDEALYFTDPVKKRATTTNVALLRTPDLFRAAQQCLKNKDKKLAKKFRETIFKSAGKEIEF